VCKKYAVGLPEQLPASFYGSDSILFVHHKMSKYF